MTRAEAKRAIDLKILGLVNERFGLGLAHSSGGEGVVYADTEAGDYYAVIYADGPKEGVRLILGIVKQRNRVEPWDFTPSGKAGWNAIQVAKFKRGDLEYKLTWLEHLALVASTWPGEEASRIKVYEMAPHLQEAAAAYHARQRPPMAGVRW